MDGAPINKREREFFLARARQLKGEKSGKGGW
jgi:hypothetical protein